MQQNTKDWIQYSSAIALIASAILIAFLCFSVINDITAGVNAYIGIAISCALAIYGVSAYMVNQVTSFKTEMRSNIRTEIRKEILNLKEEEGKRNDHSGGQRPRYQHEGQEES